MGQSLLLPKRRYLQIAFNDDLDQARRVLRSLPRNDRLLVEAGTPFIKKEGFRGVEVVASLWQGKVVADIKTMDGATGEVDMVAMAGATAATALGVAPRETLNLFIARCRKLKLVSMVDMLGTQEPLRVLMGLQQPPDVVVLHKGRDEESTRGKVIPYKQINKIRSKYSMLISAAGGIDLKEARSAIFNGADIVVANLVSRDDPWIGINSEEDVRKIAVEFLKTIG